ncbi:MAG: helix-turn-helix transcriptional regulator [Methanomassiliicoccales archaeon]
MQNRIREIRTSKGITQEELAKRVGICRETIVFLEKNAYNPSLRLAHAVAIELGTSIDDLFSFDDD